MTYILKESPRQKVQDHSALELTCLNHRTLTVVLRVIPYRLQVNCLMSLSSVQFSRSVVSDSLRPQNLSTPGLPVHHQLSESTQTHVHRVSDNIQPSHPLSSPSPPALNLSQHQSLFKGVSSLRQVAKVLEFQPQHQSFQ